MAPPGSCGFVYVATGDRYWREAARSAAQLRRTNPGHRICVIGDKPTVDPFWDDCIAVSSPSYSFRDKLLMRLCPYDRFVYLDTDTHVVAPLDEVFQLLDHFDVAGHQLFEGHDSPVDGVPDAFPEIQGGVLAFRRSTAVASFFERWQQLYDTFRAPDRPDRDAYANITDQKSLRLAVFQSDLRLAVLGPEYNFTPAHVNFACAPVRVLHGRGDDFASFATRINGQLGNRVYHPTLDVVLHAQTQAGELRRLWWRTTLQLLRYVGVALFPLAIRNWLRRSPSVRRWFFGGRFAP